MKYQPIETGECYDFVERRRNWEPRYKFPPLATGFLLALPLWAAIFYLGYRVIFG